MKGTYLTVIPDILKANASEPLPTKVSIKLAKLNKELEDNLSIYKTVLNQLVENYVQKDKAGVPLIEDDGTVTLKSDCTDKWKKEYNDLENSEFEFKISFTEDELNLMKLTPLQASVMMTLIKENSGDYFSRAFLFSNSFILFSRIFILAIAKVSNSV